MAKLLKDCARRYALRMPNSLQPTRSQRLAYSRTKNLRIGIFCCFMEYYSQIPSE
jgi:hypothetical protein